MLRLGLFPSSAVIPLREVHPGQTQSVVSKRAHTHGDDSEFIQRDRLTQGVKIKVCLNANRSVEDRPTGHTEADRGMEQTKAKAKRGKTGKYVDSPP